MRIYVYYYADIYYMCRTYLSEEHDSSSASLFSSHSMLETLSNLYRKCVMYYHSVAVVSHLHRSSWHILIVSSSLQPSKESLLQVGLTIVDDDTGFCCIRSRCVSISKVYKYCCNIHSFTFRVSLD